MKRTIFVGDIHGCGQELCELLSVCAATENDTIVLLGDVFDRGVYQDKVWNVVKQKNVITIKGNHERKLFRWLNGDRDGVPSHYILAVNKLMTVCSIEELYEFLSGLQHHITEEGDDSYGLDIGTPWVAVHAAVDIYHPLRDDEQINVYGYTDDKDGDKFWDRYDKDNLVIYGHESTHNQLPRICRNSQGRVNSIGIDTSAAHGGPLTAYCLEEDKFYHFRSSINWYGKVRQACARRAPVVHQSVQDFIKRKKVVNDS